MAKEHPDDTAFAHSLLGRPTREWEPLSDHLRQVATLASLFAEPFASCCAAHAAGTLHDIGKCSRAFQDYIRAADAPDRPAGRVDHSSAGAIEAARLWPGAMGRSLAFAIAGHHAGLADGIDLARRLESRDIESYVGWQNHAGPLPDAASLAPSRRPQARPAPGFTHMFWVRMLFSCLVDADWLATEAFVSGAEDKPVARGGFTDLATLQLRLRDHMAALLRSAPATPLNALRAEVHDHAAARADLPPGLFTFTVPTGGGKTLSSLAFALEHAGLHGLSRVIYVIPFTSIIEQTARVFRDALGTQRDVLEHHASFDWERARTQAAADDEGPAGIEKLRRASENWDAPVVVTTAVQFYESLFSNRRSRCRKLHNLAGAVIVLDEAQMLPIHLLRPSLAALEELAANYGASVVICTATQPAWRKIDDALRDAKKRPIGLDIGPERELAPDPPELHARLLRVSVEVMREPVPDAAIVARFAGQDRMLCIVNSRGHARTLYDLIASLPGALHLTTLMCARHRETVLADARARLLTGEPVRLVATSLIEAGVDIDFPEVWRAAAGLDQIAQAAGRCNREGGSTLGRVVVFEPADAKPPAALRTFWQAAQPALRRHAADVLSPEAVRSYFQELYFQRGDAAALDAAKLDGKPWPILPAIAERARDASFPFRSVAEAYHLIDDAMEPVIVPYDEDAKAILARLAVMDRPLTDDLRRIQPYLVGLPRQARLEWLASGVLLPVNAALGDALLRFADMSHYLQHTGVNLAAPAQRKAEDNIA